MDCFRIDRGALARLVLYGSDHRAGSPLNTGVAGSIVGGFIAGLVFEPPDSFQPAASFLLTVGRDLVAARGAQN